MKNNTRIGVVMLVSPWDEGWVRREGRGPSLLRCCALLRDVCQPQISFYRISLASNLPIRHSKACQVEAGRGSVGP